MTKFSRLALVSKHNYFAMKKDKPWFSKWRSHERLPDGALKARRNETEFQRYKRLALARGDRILYVVNCYPKGTNDGERTDPQPNASH